MNMIHTKIIAVLALSYCIGSLPFSLMLARFHGMPDPRSYGSKNIGATNVGRHKFSMGLAVFLLDASKVFISIALARYLEIQEYFLPLVWSSAILGQTRSMFLRLKGGKGVSCFIAGIGILYPTWFIPLAIPGITVLLLSSRVWCASICIVSLFLSFSITLPLHYFLVNTGIALWIICMHAGNFQYHQKQKEKASALVDPLPFKSLL